VTNFRGTQQQATIEIHGDGIRIANVEIVRKDVADFFSRVDVEERVCVLVRAIEVGAFCLERASNTNDVEYVRRQVEGLLTRVETAISAIPERTQLALLQQIGSNEGQVLAPLKGLISEVTKTTTVRLNDVRDLLARDLDPAKETSTLGKVLHSLRELLDVKRRDSVQATIESAVKSVTDENGVLATAVRTVVAKALAPLEGDLRDLAKEVRGQDAAAEALSQTTAKGISYEEQVVERLREWANMSGAEIHHVGVDNQPGDIVVRIPSDSIATESFAVAVETRDRQVGLGRKAISDILSRSMIHRSAVAAIYVSRSREGLAKEIGDWAEGACGAGRFIACTDEHVVAALRWLVLQGRLNAMRASVPDFDPTSVELQIKRVRTALERVKSINRKVTDVRSSAQEIQEDAEFLREEIRGALCAIEDVLRAVPERTGPVSVHEPSIATA